MDLGCIDALATALGSWGGKDGALCVISHDRNFCEAVGFTHIGTVSNGALVLEQRPLRESDWEVYDMDAKNSKFV